MEGARVQEGDCDRESQGQGMGRDRDREKDVGIHAVREQSKFGEKE